MRHDSQTQHVVLDRALCEKGKHGRTIGTICVGWGLCGGGSAVQCWVPNWEGRALATQESVCVFGRYTLENSRLTGHHVKKKKMEQKW